MDTKDFAKVVAEYIGYDPASGSYDEDKKRELAGKFECIPSTVVRWASGVANPHPRVKQLIIKYIQKQKTGV